MFGGERRPVLGCCLGFLIAFTSVDTRLSAEAAPIGIDLFEKENRHEEALLEEMALEGPTGRVPALWHIEIVGADLAKDHIDNIKSTFAPHTVIVMDSGVIHDAAGVVNEPPRQKRMVTPRQLLNRGDPRWQMPLAPLEDQESSENLGGLGRLYGQDFFDLDRQILDPREYDIPAASIHGDHVAGTVGAGGHKFGVSNLADIYSLNIFDTPRYTQREDVIQTVNSLADSHSQGFTLNMSISFHPFPDSIEAYRRLFAREDVVAVMAADNRQQPIRPFDSLSKLPEAIVVGAFSPAGVLAGFSNYGERLDLIAPGESILSRGNKLEAEGFQLEMASGTSMATPMVTGTIANLRAILPELSREEIRSLLQKTSWDLQLRGEDDNTGHGLLNTLKATKLALRMRERLDSGENGDDVRRDNRLLDFEEESRAALHKSLKDGLMGHDSLRELRKFVLLSENIENFKLLAAFYNSSFPSYAAGLRLMVHNRPQVTEEETKLKKILNDFTLILSLQNEIYGVRPLVRNLANSDLIFHMADLISYHPSLFGQLYNRLYISGANQEMRQSFLDLIEEKKIKMEEAKQQSL